VHNYNPRFGILLDMVGASDAMFNKDDYSVGVANDVVNLVWNTAGKLGYGSYFPHNEINGVIDDHVMLGNAGIRCIDIIDTRPHIAAMGLGSYQFGSYHHTHKDNMDIIDRNTLKAVGQTVMQVIYNQ
jgi:glutaminyl-peptide cyclotransferase